MFNDWLNHGPTTMDIPFRAALPLLGIGGLALIFSCLFCCYLYRLRREGEKELQKGIGYKEVPYRKRKGYSDVCAVCLEDFKPAEIIAVCTCRHSFHCKCLVQWLDHSNTCPMCKARVRQEPGENTRLVPEMAITHHV